jgi:competence protein ComEC
MGRFTVLAVALVFIAGSASASHGCALWALVTGVAIAGCAYRVSVTARTVLIAALALGTLDALALAPAALPAGDRHVRRFAATLLEMHPNGLNTWTAVVRLPDGAHAAFEGTNAPPPVGARLVVRGQREPFDGPRNPGEPSESELEAERGVTWHLAHASVLKAAAPDDRDPSLWIARARAWASARLHATLPEPGATILAGAMWGERGSLPPSLRAEFQDTGTVHVLVTAGLHLGVVAALALACLRALRCGRIAATVSTIAIVWAYAAFSGAHLPAVRAATMLSFGLAAYAAGRNAFSWNALGAAALVIAAVRPAAVDSVSFGLSFSCVAAILAFAKPLRERFEGWGVPHIVAEVFGVSVAAQLGTWPLTAATFLVVAPYAPLANALVVPVVGIAMLVGFAALAATPLPALATLASNVEVSLLDWIVACVRDIGELPGARVVATPPPGWTIAAYDVVLAFAAFTLARGHRLRIALLPVAIASAVCLCPPRPAARELAITAIDVGQADAILIRTPAGHAYLVDAGGRLERGSSGEASRAEAIGERVVVPFLIRQGVHHLDAILLSHPHGDHSGGIAPVLRELGAGAFADSGQAYPGHAYHDALDVAQTDHVPMLEPRGGDVWRTDDGVTFRFYGPSNPYISGSRNDINNNSLVFRLEYRHFAMLFTGDAGAEAEGRLLASAANLRADVLKVGHHGSAYGSTPAFVAVVRPRCAIISVGRHNLFGHPAPQTLDTLRRAGATIYRTDVSGAVTIHSDGTGFAADSFLSP